MTGPTPADPDPTGPGAQPRPGFLRAYAGRRRDRIVAEVERNRRGGHLVPTWVLVLVLLAVVALWGGLIALA